MRLTPTLGRLLPQSALFAALGLAFALPASAATITVDSATDDGAGCTLREAVASANTDTAVGGCTAGDDSNDEIQFAVATVTLTAGQLTITEEVTVSGPVTITAASGSRIFQVDGDDDVSFADVTFQGGRDNGGALLITGGADVTVTDGAATQNRAPVFGGAFWVSAEGSLTVDGTSFTGNQARGSAANEGGGAIYTDGGDVTVTDATFTDNRALGTSGSGGAILNPNGASLTVMSSAFTLNRSQRAGGAIETVGGATLITGGSFDRNTAGTNPGNGGAVHGGGDVSIVIAETVATGNRANEGGAYWISGSGTMTLQGITATGNIAEGADADKGGGAVYSDGGTLRIDTGSAPSNLSQNRATGASGSGGAVLVNGGTAMFINVTFSQNRSQRAGGAIEITAGDADDEVEVTVSSGTFMANVTAMAPGNGGAIHTTTGDIDLTIADTEFSGNEAGSEGGALWINTGTMLALMGSDLTSNEARGSGADNGGGGLYVNGGDATVTTTTINANRTFGQTPAGGGILAGGGTTTVSQSLIVNNTSGNGGGLAVLDGASATVENSTIYANNARLGGGVFSMSGSIDFDSATIAENEATVGGGGLYNQNTPNQGDPFVTLRNTIVADNQATNGPNLQGRYGSNGWNVIGTTPSALTFPAQSSDQTGTDPMLEPLADNGGPTLTAALMSGSPAIDAGNTDLDVDQRGVARTEPDDVGAVEFGDATGGGEEGMALVITGVIDATLSGGTPKAIEFYVLEDVADLSVYGVESANNGGGADGPEFTFPAVSASAGDFIYVASEVPNFTEWFGFAPDYTAGAANINGDDAIVLYFTGDGDNEVVDTFGDPDTDGTGEEWEYTNGWAYRSDGTGPDGDFDPDNWFYSGVDALNGETSNDTADTPFPVGSYSPGIDQTILAAPASLVESMTEPVRLGVAPNPFGARASATFAVAEGQPVTVALYDVMGRRVQDVFSGPAQAETPFEVDIDGLSLAAGVYVLVLQGETVRATRQVTVAR
ncbi:choice-of-anchor Q domain-containing protein [Rubrivirga sp.]|uniref:choice-of-anchor Q domain-containing protein n=1 Tax=Rubrivirga sp. TaxID=1885344 RepID=UPI003B52586B